MVFWMKTNFKFFFLATILNLTFTNNVFSQAPAAEEEKFNNLGSIAYSNNYKVAPDFDHIIFRIRNQSTLSIDKIYGWVYHISEDEEGNPLILSLVN